MRSESRKYLYDILRACETTWGIVQADVPKLRDQVARLLG